MYKKVFSLAVVAVTSFGMILSAASSVNQSLSITAGALEDITVSGGVTFANGDFSYNGDGTFTASDATTTLDYFTNNATKKITAVLGTAMTAGITVTLVASGGTATGSPVFASAITLSNSAQDLITSAGDTAIDGATLTYNVTVDADSTGSYSDNVTFAIAAE